MPLYHRTSWGIHCTVLVSFQSSEKQMQSRCCRASFSLLQMVYHHHFLLADSHSYVAKKSRKINQITSYINYQLGFMSWEMKPLKFYSLFIITIGSPSSLPLLPSYPLCPISPWCLEVERPLAFFMEVGCILPSFSPQCERLRALWEFSFDTLLRCCWRWCSSWACVINGIG